MALDCITSKFYFNMLFFLLISLVYINCADRGVEIISKEIITMTTPIVRRSNQSSQSKKPERASSLLLASRRFAAWAAEITLVVTSGLIPFGIGVYANSRSDLNRVPLNPVLALTKR